MRGPRSRRVSAAAAETVPSSQDGFPSLSPAHPPIDLRGLRALVRDCVRLRPSYLAQVPCRPPTARIACTPAVRRTSPTSPLVAYRSLLHEVAHSFRQRALYAESCSAGLCARKNEPARRGRWIH